MIYDTFVDALVADPDLVWYEHAKDGTIWRFHEETHGACLCRPLFWWERILLAFGGRP